MNKQLSVLLVDDEELARKLSVEYLRAHTDLAIIGECETGMEAVDAINKLNPDLIFLDIQMPELSGLEVLELTGRRHGVVFTTAYDQYALKAFDMHAIDYLLKPYSQQRFDEALHKARKLLGTEALAAPATHAIDKLVAMQSEKLQRLLIRDRGHVHVISLESIDYVEAQDDYILIHAAGKSYMKTQSLSELETQLDTTRFVRTHRSFLLSVSALKSIEKASKDSHVAILKNGAQVPVSRAGYERLKTVFN